MLGCLMLIATLSRSFVQLAFQGVPHVHVGSGIKGKDRSAVQPPPEPNPHIPLGYVRDNDEV